MTHDPENVPCWGIPSCVGYYSLVLICKPYTKFAISSFTRFEKRTKAQKLKMGLVTLP